MSETQKNKLTVFLDYVGRTIVGEVESEDDKNLNVINPVVLSTVPTQDNRMSIQLFPLFFREFLAEKDADVTFSFKKDIITIVNIDALDFRLQSQYLQIFNKNNLYVPNNTTGDSSESNSPNVVKLFDE
jgi:hypothetical protein